MKHNLLKVLILSTILIIGLPIIASAYSPVDGGDVDRNPVLSFSFFGRYFGTGGEVEVDIGLASWLSLAPRMGFNDYWLSPGISLRFGLIGIRPHGFWLGPSFDFYYHTWNVPPPDERTIFVVPTLEIGYRYTFLIGLSLTGFMRFGAYTWKGYGYFYWGGGFGIGYAF